MTRHLSLRDLERIAASLVALTGMSWSVRGQCIIATRMPSGRMFYAEHDQWNKFWSGFTYASRSHSKQHVSHSKEHDLRCAGSARDATPRDGERQEDLDAMVIASIYERAAEDPRNATRYWPDMQERPDLYRTLDRTRERWAAEDLAEAIGARAR